MFVGIIFSVFMSYRKTELPVLRSIDENKGQKRLKEVLPRDLVKQSKYELYLFVIIRLTALSSADTNSAVLLENSESASLNKKFAVYLNCIFKG